MILTAIVSLGRGSDLSWSFWIVLNAGGMGLGILLIREGNATPEGLRWAELVRRRETEKTARKHDTFGDLDGL